MFFYKREGKDIYPKKGRKMGGSKLKRQENTPSNLPGSSFL